MQLIGVSDEEIIKDYALTRVGGEPMREMMVKRFAPLLQDPEVGEASVNALSCRLVQYFFSPPTVPHFFYSKAPS